MSRHFGTVVNAGLRGPRGELLLQADALSAGPVGAEPDAEQVIERIICRPVREHPGISGKFIKQALPPEQPVVDVILARRQRPPPVTPLPLIAIERCRLLRSHGPVKRKQDIDSQPPRHSLDPIEITWTGKTAGTDLPTARLPVPPPTGASPQTARKPGHYRLT